jgi:4-oxalomesaconate tautomerase
VFLAADLPDDPAARDALPLRVMGSPDLRQIDGIGGADPLTSEVTVPSPSPSPSSRADADVDYLFLQVFVEQALVSDAQGCGDILAAVGPAALERGLVAPTGDVTPIHIHMRNTGEVAEARIHTPGGRVSYCGPASVDGGAGGPRADPAIVPWHRRIDVRGAAAQRQPG